MLAVYVCEFALGEGEVAEVAVFTGGYGGTGFCLMFIFAFVLAVCHKCTNARFGTVKDQLNYISSSRS